MVYRFKNLADVTTYINVMVTPSVRCTEATVIDIIASFIAADMEEDTYETLNFKSMVLNGLPPLNGETWIKNLYVKIDNVPVDQQAQYIDQHGNPNELLYLAIADFYKIDFHLLKDPVE